MDELDDPRYAELTELMFVGECPAWVPDEARPGLQVASERKRTELARILAGRAPRFSYYGAATHGLEMVHGVARALLTLRSGANSLFDRSVDAAELWASRTDPVLSALLSFDRMMIALPRYHGPDTQRIRSALDLPEDFALHHFDVDILGFTQLLDRLKKDSAPIEFVRRYRPIPRRQVLVAFRVGGQVRALEWDEREA